MTVPTNNEEADRARLFELWQCHGASIESDSSEGREMVDKIIEDGFRRLPVSGDNAELSDETLRQTYLDAAVAAHESMGVGAGSVDSRIRELNRIGLRAVANLSASQPREAAPSDTDPEALINQLRGIEHYYGGELRDWMRNAAGQAADALSRTSQPVQVEVTDDMVERAVTSMFVYINDEKRQAMRVALSAALGGAS